MSKRFGTASMVLGLISLPLSFVFVVGLLSWPLSIIGLTMGEVAYLRRKRSGTVKAGIVLNLLALIVCAAWLSFSADAF